MSLMKSSVVYGGNEYRFEIELEEHRFFKSRDDLPGVFNQLELKGEGVEVGVLKGEFSEVILNHWEGKQLHLVDPWKCFHDAGYMDDALVSQAEQDENHRVTIERLSRFKDRYKIHRMTSAEAALQFVEGCLDFVYIDAQHQYEAIKEDLALWYSKVKKGGIFGGHDFFNIDEGTKNIVGVRRAVEEMCAEKKLDYFVSVEDWSWFVIV